MCQRELFYYNKKCSEPVHKTILNKDCKEMD